MHQCLQIVEIISQVFDELDGYIYDTRMRYPTRIVHRNQDTLRTLAGLARTCGTFKEPALDVLWREIPDLFVLIKHLIPEELLRYEETSKVLFLREEPSPDAWRILDPYVARIRAIGIPPPSGVAVRGLDPETVLRPLDRHLREISLEDDTLFPRLEHVVYQAFWEHELHSRLLLAPRLQVLQLPCMAYTSAWSLSSLANEHYVSTVGKCMSTLGTHVLGALNAMHHLRTLWVRSALLDQPTLHHLGTLPTLTGFALEGGWSRIRYPRRTETGPHAFAALREVSVSIAHNDAPDFLSHIYPEHLEAVNIHWEYLYSHASSSAAVLEQIFTVLSGLRGFKHLSVALDEGMERTMEQTGDDPAASAFTALTGLACTSWEPERVLSLTSLRTLEIGIDVVFQVNDEFLLALAEKLPHLESLRLVPLLRGPFSFEYWSDHDEGVDVLEIPSLDGLLPFVARCTKLTKLRLAVRGTLSQDFRREAARGVLAQRMSRLRTLELWATALDEGVPEEEFVAFFVHAFPCLEELYVVVSESYSELTGQSLAGRDEARARWEQVVRQVCASLEGQGQQSGGRIRWAVI